VPELAGDPHGTLKPHREKEQMTQAVAIPGRRISSGEAFRTDWVPRGGDCVLLRVQVLFEAAAGLSLVVTLETRGEDGTTVTTMTPTSPSAGMEITAAGMFTCLYLAKTNTTAGNGAQEEVRVVLAMGSDEVPGYFVVRILPLIFFDSARDY
jgi:hypothetical protein